MLPCPTIGTLIANLKKYGSSRPMDNSLPHLNSKSDAALEKAAPGSGARAAKFRLPAVRITTLSPPVAPMFLDKRMGESWLYRQNPGWIIAFFFNHSTHSPMYPLSLHFDLPAHHADAAD